MYAIVDIAGKQFQVEKDQKLRVPLLDAKSGEELSFDTVLLYRDDDETKIGTPTVEGAAVKAEVLEHGRSKKIIVFKKKRRKGYKVKRGHRQKYTEIEIKDIIV